MITEQTMEKMSALKLFGLRDAFSEQLEQPSYASLTFEERVGMLIDREWTDRENRKQKRRMKAARLKIGAHMEQIDYSPARGLYQAGQWSFWPGGIVGAMMSGKIVAAHILSGYYNDVTDRAYQFVRNTVLKG